jgi:hypothetical protein
MGICLSFYANFQEITPQAWEVAYEETLFWLEKFPVPLMRLDMIPVGEKQFRYSWTTNLCEKKGKLEEKWEVWGDFHTRSTGESFELYRNMVGRLEGKHPKSKERVSKAFSPNSIFYVSEGYEYHNPEFGIDVFDQWSRKTQGEPYHLAILAVCICLENHFEGKGYVSGDFDLNQAQEVIKWMESHTNKSIELPICCDQARLWKQVVKAYTNPCDAIRRHLEICKTEREETYKFLADVAGRQNLFEVLATQIETYSSITQYGAIDVWLGVLSVWQDIDVLLDFVSFANSKKEKDLFVWSELLESLCKEYVTVNPLLKERANFLHPETEDLPSVDDMLMQAIFAMGGSRKKKLQLYIPKEEIWEAFMAKNPQEAELYKKILEKAEKANAKELEKMNKKIEEIENALIDQQEQAEQQAEQEKMQKRQAYQASIDTRLLEYRAEDRYIVRQVLLKEPRFADLGASIASMGKQAREFLAAHPKFQYKSLADSLQSIKIYAHTASLVLKESTWAKIDQIQDLELLNLFGVLIAWKMDGKNDSDWRKYCLEFSDYWEVFKKG